MHPQVATIIRTWADLEEVVLRAEKRRNVNYPDGHPESAIDTCSLMHGAALTLAGRDDHRFLEGG
ncbi:hypothetical protein ABZ746_37420 [Streptomyces sp. NPDC020096]